MHGNEPDDFSFWDVLLFLLLLVGIVAAKRRRAIDEEF